MRPRSLLWLLVAGSIMTYATVSLLTLIGNPSLGSFFSIWQPWPQEELWDVVQEAYYAESARYSRFYGGYPEAFISDRTSTLEYSTGSLQVFDITDESIYWRMSPARPNGGEGTDLYQSFGFFDAGGVDNYFLAKAEIEGSPGSSASSPPFPYSTTPASYDNLVETKWDPSGTYLAVGGYNDAFTQFFAWYKHDGAGTLTKLANPSSVPQGADGMAWDSTGTYLAIGANTWWGMENAVYLYKRSGDTLSRVSTVLLGSAGGAGRCDWVGDYLIIGAAYSYTNPWNGGKDGIGIYRRSGDSLSFVDSEGGPYPRTYGWDVHSIDVHPDGDYVLISYFDQDDNDYYIRIYAWDESGYLTLVTSGGSGADYRGRAFWSPDGNYFSVAVWGDTNGIGASISSWDSATETASGISQSSSGLSTFHGSVPLWTPDGAYVVVVGQDIDDTTQWRMFSSAAGVLTFSGSGTGESTYAYGGDISPDGAYLAVGFEGGNCLALYSLSGGLIIRLTVAYGLAPYGEEDIVTETWEAAYDEDVHGWIRLVHTQSGDGVYMETAGGNCECWTERLAVALDSGVSVGSVGLKAEAWVVTHPEDEEEPTKGYFGPLNPSGNTTSLYLLTAIGPVPQLGGDILASLSLVTQILG